MKVAIVFFLSVCFQLLAGNNKACAGFGNDRFNDSSVQIIKQKQPTEVEKTKSNQPIIKDNSINEKKEAFISLENEDDDDSFFSRKYVQLVRCFVMPVYGAVLICCSTTFENRLPCCRHLSYSSSHKYLLQRVLRL